MSEYVCCMDFGTTRIKAAVFDEAGALVSMADATADVVAGEGGGVEFPADRHFAASLGLIREAVEKAGVRPDKVAAICVTGQRASVVPLDNTGNPAAAALSWQDTRCASTLGPFGAAFGDTRRFAGITGLPFGALWSLAKIMWLKKNRKMPVGTFAMMHDYATRMLRGSGELLTEPSNASLSGLMDISRLQWSPEILSAAGISENELPRIIPSATRAGKLAPEIAARTGLVAGTPVIVGGGDQQCAALGTGAARPGTAGLCLGTAAVISCPCDRPVTDAGGKFFCTAHAAPGLWVVEGIHNCFGSSLHWAADVLGLAAPGDIGNLAASAPSSPDNPMFLPHLSGIGSPDFDSAARGAFFGLSLSHGPAHIARAVVDGVALEMRRIIESIEAHTGILEIVISGGPSIQETMLQPLANLIDRTLLASDNHETTLLGAAILAWTGAGKFADVLEGVSKLTARSATPVPLSPRNLPRGIRESIYSNYIFRVESTKRRV